MTTVGPELAELDRAVDELTRRFGSTLGEILTRRAATDPDKSAVDFVDYSVDRHGVVRSLTFAELDRSVTARAATLHRRWSAGERIAVLAPQGPEFIVGFLAALRAGLVAVPLFSPDLPGHGDRLTAVLADCAPAAVLATSANAGVVTTFVGTTPVLVVDEIDPTAGGGWTPPVLQAGDLAYLQYTSGSTRLPAGVRITHGNVVHNAALALVNGRATPDSTLVSWLPLFHDMGLVFVVGGSLVGGMTSVLLDPIAFLMKPARWLQHLSDHPQSFTAAPNFAYDFVAKRVDDRDRERLDLSGVLIMFNGAEPIHPETLTRFYDTFAPQGLRRGVIAPSYGLAEATVYVTSHASDHRPQAVDFDLDALSRGRAEPAAADHPTAHLVASGSELGTTVAIADPATGSRLAEGGVGEIWVRTDSVGQGYWDKPELTGEVFDQVLLDAGDLPGGGWLRTGDLGVVVDDRLFVTGRIKDVLIVDGRNHYPQDIEFTVENAHWTIGRHRTAAFSVATPDGERAVVVAEISRHHVASEWDAAEVGKAVAAAVAKEHGLALRELVLIAPDTIPRTTSGKIARAAARTALQEQTLTLIRSQG